MKERLAVLEEKTGNVELSLGQINRKLDSHAEKLDRHMESLAKNHFDFTEMADARYANKIVEKVVYSMVGIILGTFLVALTKFVGWW